jgi:hypothetical protein
VLHHKQKPSRLSTEGAARGALKVVCKEMLAARYPDGETRSRDDVSLRRAATVL